MIDQYKTFVANARTQGLPDATIQQQLTSIGTPPEVIAQVLTRHTLPATSGTGQGLGVGVTPASESRSVATVQRATSLSLAQLVTPASESRSVATAVLDSLGEALEKVDPKRRPISDGTHRVRVENVDVKETHYGVKFFVEFAIVESTNPSNQPGETYSFGRALGPMLSLADRRKYERSNRDIREWVTLATTALRGAARPFQIEDLKWVRSPEQPCRGLAMKCVTSSVPTKAGFTFIKFDWAIG